MMIYLELKIVVAVGCIFISFFSFNLVFVFFTDKNQLFLTKRMIFDSKIRNNRDNEEFLQ